MTPADTIVTHVDVHFSFWDRVKILINGEAHVRVETECENLPGIVKAKSEVSVPPLVQRRQQGGGYAALEGQKFITVVHKAGYVMAGDGAAVIQKCSRCGKVLIDTSGLMSMDGAPPLLYNEGRFVGSTNFASFVMDHDAQESDEVTCVPI